MLSTIAAPKAPPRRSQGRGRRFLAIALALAAGCTTTYERAQREDTADAWRAVLAENPDEDVAYEARKRLEKLEFEQARSQHTILAYKRFLDEFPRGDHAPDAKSLLESLRFDEAKKAGTAGAWEAFLADEPSGRHAGAAREALAALELERAKQGSVKDLELFAARFPGSPQRDVALALADDRTFAQVADADGVARYLADFPDGRHRAEVRAKERRLELAEMDEADDLAGAQRAASSWGGEEGALAKQIAARIGWRRAVSALDATGIEDAAAALAPEEAARAREQAKALRAHPPSAEVRDLVAKLRPDWLARPQGDLVHVLADAADPRTRWLAAEELGATGDMAALEPLVLAAATSRDLQVRLSAGEAAFELAKRIGPAATRRAARGRLEALAGKDGPEVAFQRALLEQLRGDKDAARADYARASPENDPDPVALVALTGVPATPPPDPVLVWHDVALAARPFAARQATGERDALLNARQLCGASRVLSIAAASLGAAAKREQADLGEDPLHWARDAAGAADDARARLADAEAAQRSKDPAFKGCADDEVKDRLAQAQSDRRDAFAKLAKQKLPPGTAEVVRAAAARLAPDLARASDGGAGLHPAAGRGAAKARD